MWLNGDETQGPVPFGLAIADMLADFARKGRRFEDIDDFRKTLVAGQYRMTYSRADLKWVSEADARVYFRTLDGRGYNSNELYFDLRNGAPLPDLVLNAPGQLRLRIIFHDGQNGEVNHEVLVEGR